MTRKATSTTDSRFRFDVLRSELAAAWNGRIRVVKVDIERNLATAERYGVQSLPTLIYFEAREEVDRPLGVIRRQTIEDRIETHAPGLAA